MVAFSGGISAPLKGTLQAPITGTATPSATTAIAANPNRTSIEFSNNNDLWDILYAINETVTLQNARYLQPRQIYAKNDEFATGFISVMTIAGTAPAGSDNIGYTIQEATL